MPAIHKSEDEWRRQLTPEQFASLRQRATEAPFTGEYLYESRPGIYACAACGNILFDAGTKFQSHCGWPTFYDARDGAVDYQHDFSHGMHRIDISAPGALAIWVMSSKGRGTTRRPTSVIASIRPAWHSPLMKMRRLPMNQVYYKP